MASDCTVCLERARLMGYHVCELCLASWNRMGPESNDVSWAATRARLFERRRVKRGKR
jgi:hypothetical protein